MSDNEEFTETPKTRGFNSGKMVLVGGGVLVLGLGLAIYAIQQTPGGSGGTPDATFQEKKKPAKPTNVKANDDQISKIVGSSDTPAVKSSASGPTVAGAGATSVPPIDAPASGLGTSQHISQADNSQDELQKQLIQTRNQAIIKREQAKFAAYGSKSLISMPPKQNSSGVSSAITSSVPSVPSEQAQKTASATAMTKLTKPKSQWFLKAGTILPCVMISGLNSENSGNIVAMVTDTVYDSRYGNKILIPQGATIMGVYNNNVAFGNSRIVPAFKTLTYPDGTVIDLQGLPGSDMSGFTGLSDQVDNHYWQLFGTSFIMGVITAGMQYSQNNTNANVQTGGIGYTNPNPTVGQTLSGSLGQQLGQTGLAMTNRQLNVAPTIIIRQRETFTIMLVSALELPPYSGE